MECECEICGITENVKDRGKNFGSLCDDCYEEEYDSIHLDDGEDE
jgi:hypothetical protein